MSEFESYLDKMGYSWNDFDRPLEVANLIEQYADEKANQANQRHEEAINLIAGVRMVLGDRISNPNFEANRSYAVSLIDGYLEKLG